MSLKEELMEIPNVGDARAEEIMRIVDNHNSNDHQEAIERALGFMERGKPYIAESVLRDAVN